MLRTLLANAATLIAALFIAGQYFIDKPINHKSCIKTKVIGGVITGAAGILLVVLGIRVTAAVVIDFRYIALIVSSMCGGPLTVVIGALIIAVFRLFYYGVSYASIIAFIFVFSAAIGCGVICKLHLREKIKWLLAVIFCLVNSIFALNFVIENKRVMIRVWLIYSLVFSLISFLVYYYPKSISASNEVVRKLKMESSKDFLTGLNNVRNFDKLYNDSLLEAYGNSENLSVAIIDIDYFKRVNDKYGHQAGDTILRQLGLILQHSCRNFDIVSRNGGEEFSILLKNCPNKVACEIAERIRRRVEAHKFILSDNKEVNITVSIGIATYPDTAQDNESLYKNADKALYEAKNSGRNRVCNYKERPIIYCLEHDGKVMM